MSSLSAAQAAYYYVQALLYNATPAAILSTQNVIMMSITVRIVTGELAGGKEFVSALMLENSAEMFASNWLPYGNTHSDEICFLLAIRYTNIIVVSKRHVVH